MSKQQWGHGYNSGFNDGLETAWSDESISYFKDESARNATMLLAREMWHLLDALSRACEQGDTEARWALLSAARRMLSHHYQWPPRAKTDEA